MVALLAVSFPEDTLANNRIRNVPGRRWSYTRRCWVVPNTRESVVLVGKLFGKEYCRFHEDVVRLYKPSVTNVEVDQATNPAWPPPGVPLRMKQRRLHDVFGRDHIELAHDEGRRFGVSFVDLRVVHRCADTKVFFVSIFQRRKFLR